MLIKGNVEVPDGIERKNKLTFQTWKNLKKAVSLKANN